MEAFKNFYGNISQELKLTFREKTIVTFVDRKEINTATHTKGDGMFYLPLRTIVTCSTILEITP